MSTPTPATGAPRPVKPRPSPPGPPSASTGAPRATKTRPASRGPPPAHHLGTHLRATAVLLVLTTLMAGFAYPLFVTAVASVLNPSGAGGSLIRDSHGTVIGSSLVAQNTSAPYLFWSRPSLSDYNTTLGAITPPGPTDPALAALINETLNYTRLYGNFTVNAPTPFWYVAPSASSIDPDLTPEAVLVQVLRVSVASNLSVAFLTDLVNAHITPPIFPGIGVPYVNVLELDVALLPYEGR